MECVLCQMWARMPYAKRYTTPTTAEQTQGAMVVGYWLHSRATSVPRMCEGHMAVLNMLDVQEEHRIAAEKRAAEIAAQQVAQAVVTPQVLDLQQRQQAVLQGHPVPQPVAPPIQPIVPVPHLASPAEALAPPQPEKPFTLGPGPLTNENTITPHPALPVTENPVAPYTGTAQPGTMEGALEAARMPAVEGGKVTYPCPSCGQEISTGDVHAC